MRSLTGQLTRAGAWPIRITWLCLPLLAGPALADGLHGASRPVQLVASAGLWLVWAGTLLASLMPATTTLTGLRIVAPAALTAVVLASTTIAGREQPTTAWDVVGTAWATVTVVVAFLPSTGATFVNGSAYGSELRMPLRVPGPLLLGPIELAWLVSVAGTTGGLLLLAAKQWVLGGVAVAVGVPAVVWGVRVLHTLARRWMVFVPGGLVLHDPLTLADPVLLRHGTVVSLGPAPVGSEALDLTAGALGLALEARFQRPVALVTREAQRARRAGSSEAVEVEAVLFSPTQPGAFLVAARSRLRTASRNG